MKKTYLIFLFFITAIGYSQSHGISYQAVLLNPKGEQLPGQNNNYSPLLDKNVCLRFEIKNSNDQLEYQETINTKTDSFGMVNLIIGSGNQTGGTAVNFNAISWNAIQKKLVVALDSEGNCNSFIEISNQDFTGVPFAFSSQNSENVTGIVAIANGGTNATTASAARTNLGLGNVNNTSDANKPISTVTQTALDTKEDKSNKSDNIISDATSITKYPSVKAIKDYIDSQSGTTGTVADATMANKGKIQLAGDLTGTASTPVIANNAITDAKVANGISASKVGLGNVDNTSDANKPISTATQTALNLKANTSDLTLEISRATTAEALKAPLASPTFTGTVSGIDKTMVGLGNVDNTSDANKPVSTATQTALNLKQNLLTNPITGTGTLNTMPKFTAGSVLGNSTISDDGTVVTISSPVKIQTLTLGSGGGAISTNTVFGKDALLANTTGVNNTAIGFESLISNTTGPSNTAIGINASRQNTTGGANVAIGINALMNNLTGANNTAVGAGALVNATGNNNSAFGLNSLLNFSSGSNVTAYGVNSGRFAGAATTTMTSANNSIYLGYLTRGLNATGSTNEVVIGNDVVGLGSNTTVLGNSSTTKSAIYGNLLLGSTTDNSTGAKLQVTGGVTVDGAITNNSSNNANSNATIDFSLSNIAYTSATSNAITITNIRDGGTYNLAITATTVSDKVIFIAPSGFTIRDMGTVNRVLGKIHLYRLVVAGTNVLVTMSIEN